MNLDEIVKCTRLTMDILKRATLIKASRGKVNIKTKIDNSFKASLSPPKYPSQIKGNSTNNYNSLQTLNEFRPWDRKNRNLTGKEVEPIEVILF